MTGKEKRVSEITHTSDLINKPFFNQLKNVMFMYFEI